MKKLLLILIIVFTYSCYRSPQKKGVMYLDGTKWIKEDTANVLVTRASIREYELLLEAHFKSDSIKEVLHRIIRFQDFQYGYQLSHLNELQGKYNTYVDYLKQWKIDSIKEVKHINEQK